MSQSRHVEGTSGILEQDAQGTGGSWAMLRVPQVWQRWPQAWQTGRAQAAPGSGRAQRAACAAHLAPVALPCTTLPWRAPSQAQTGARSMAVALAPSQCTAAAINPGTRMCCRSGHKRARGASCAHDHLARLNPTHNRILPQGKAAPGCSRSNQYFKQSRCCRAVAGSQVTQLPHHTAQTGVGCSPGDPAGRCWLECAATKCRGQGRCSLLCVQCTRASTRWGSRPPVHAAARACSAVSTSPAVKAVTARTYLDMRRALSLPPP